MGTHFTQPSQMTITATAAAATVATTATVAAAAAAFGTEMAFWWLRVRAFSCLFHFPS